MSRQCNHARSSWAGIVTNQPERLTVGGKTDPSRPLSSRWVCGREACIDAAIRACAAETNETATFVERPRIARRAAS